MEQTRKVNKPIQFSVGNTALLTCKMREMETKKSDALFKDEFAEKFGGNEATQIMDDLTSFAKPSSDLAQKNLMTEHLAIRHRFFDDFILEKISKLTSDRQVVIGAAGLDSRAFRFDWPQETTVFELDNEEMLHFKDQRIQQHKMEPKCKRIAIPCDFRESKWKDALMAKGYKKDKPSVWIFEGLFPYLPEKAVNKLLKDVVDLSAPNSWICCDVGLKMRDEKKAQELLEYLKALDAPLLSLMPEPKETFQKAGWDQIQVTLPTECSYARTKETSENWPSGYVTACKTATQG
jgi:methyltransferase (TIGR00027 family)